MVCGHFGKCGGCSYSDISYEDELRLKENNMQELFGSETLKVFEGIVPAPRPCGYRNKMEFAFGDEGSGNALALGIRNRRSFYEVSVPRECCLIPDEFKNILLCALEYFRGAGETFFHRRKHTGALRHLVLRRGEFTGEVLINLSTSSAFEIEAHPQLIDNLLGVGENVAGILHSVNDGVSDTVKNENVKTIFGRDFYYERLCGLIFKVPAFSFFQTNSAAAEILYGKVKEFAGTGEIFFDLYCGSGTIAQVVSANASLVAGVEISNESVVSANENASINKIGNCVFVAGDVLNMAAQLSFEYGRPAAVIVDPPRDGLHPKALPKIARLGADRIVYVSCKPSSLARDIIALKEHGYRVSRLASVDMFPRTPNIESVCLFEK